jgi:hypothetical protein
MSSMIGSGPREAAAARRGRLPRHTVAAALVVLVTLWSSSADAEILLFSANNNLQEFVTTTGRKTAFAALNGSGATSLSFTTTAPKQRVLITFNAGCAVLPESPDANYFGGNVSVDILVDPAGSVGEILVPPFNAASRHAVFCGDEGTGWTQIGATIVASARPDEAGVHRVRVRLDFGPYGASISGVRARFFQTSLAVVR